MKTIYFVRHAKSSWDNPTLSDHDRPLNDRGKSDAPLMADLLTAREKKCDGIITSTAKRARATAKHFQKAFGLQKEQVIKVEELYHAYPAQITAVVRSIPAEWNTVLLFGHNPGFTELANELIGDYIDNVPTCGIIGARADVTDWAAWSPAKATRHCFYFPKQFS